MKMAGWDPTWVLVYTSAIMMVLRFNAGPVINRFGPLGLLAICSALAMLGLYLLSFSTGMAFIFVSATIYGLAKTYFWPTMLGVVSEQTPKGGALTINAIAGIGMLTVGILASPLIGDFQESSVTGALKEEKAAIYENIVQENSYLLGEYSALDLVALGKMSIKVQDEVNEIRERETQGALVKMIIFPGFMFVCFIGLILFFKTKGGYRPQLLGGDSR